MQCANVVQSDPVMNEDDRRSPKLRAKLFVTGQEELIVVDSACFVSHSKKKSQKNQQLIATEKRRVFKNDLLN